VLILMSLGVIIEKLLDYYFTTIEMLKIKNKKQEYFSNWFYIYYKLYSKLIPLFE
jgi:hypothetical protein